MPSGYRTRRRNQKAIHEKPLETAAAGFSTGLNTRPSAAITRRVSESVGNSRKFMRETPSGEFNSQTA